MIGGEPYTLGLFDTAGKYCIVCYSVACQIACKQVEMSGFKVRVGLKGIIKRIS